MLDRGISLAISLVVFSLSQVGTMIVTMVLTRVVDKIQDKNKLVQSAFVLRIILIGAMFFTRNPIVFAVLFIAHQLASATNFLFEGMIAQWSADKGLVFSRLRFFGSAGFSVGGFITTGIVVLTGDLNYILLFIFFVNLFNLLGMVKAPVDLPPPPKPNEKQKTTVKAKHKALIFLGSSVMAFPNSFGMVLNYHYRSSFFLSYEEAIFFAGVAIFLGSFLAELIAFFSVDKLISMFTAQKIIMAGMVMSFIRWSVAAFSTNHFMFTFTYFFHGLSFVPLYIGILHLIKLEIGNDHTSKLVMQFIIFSAMLNIVWVQIANVVLNFFTANVLLLMYAVGSVIVGSMFYIFYMKGSRM